MADPFQEMIGYLTAISAMFGLFVGVVCFAINAIYSSKENKGVANRNFIKERAVALFINSFFRIACIIFFFELFYVLVIFFITDKTFGDFYWFEFLVFIGVVYTFNLMIQYSYHIIYFSVYLNENEYYSHFKKVITF